MAEELPTRIKELREARGWSLRDMEERSGITHSKLHRMENGTTPPDFNDLRRIAKAFDVRISALLRDEDVEVRVDQYGQDLLDLLVTVPAAQRPDVLVAAQHVARAIIGVAATRSAAALRGDPALVDQLAEHWNNLQDNDRTRAIALWDIAGLKRTG